MKYGFIKAHKEEYSIRFLCAVMCVSTSGYYNWINRKESKRAQENRLLLAAIEDVHQRSRGIYGAVKVWYELKAQGFRCGLNRVKRLRQQAGIVAKRVIRFRRTESGRERANTSPAPNLLSQEFSATSPNEKWVSDTTFIPTRKGWLYLATVMDLYSRKVVGWSMSNKNNRVLVKEALLMAIGRRKLQVGLICHSDQGVQYTCKEYQSLLAEHGIQPSMSRKGCCWDNAVAESFFNNLKNELTWSTSYINRNEARTAIFDYIEIFYNRQRIHQSLGYKTPHDFESECVT